MTEGSVSTLDEVSLSKIGDGVANAADLLDGNQKPKQYEERHPRKLLGKNSLFWGLSTAQTIHQPLIARLLALKPKPAKSEKGFDFAAAASEWCEQEDAGPTSWLEGLAWCYALPYLKERLGNEDLQNLVEKLLGGSAGEYSSAIEQFLATVEVPMALGFAAPNQQVGKELRRDATSQFEAMLEAVCDGQGTPHARNLPDIQMLLASCTRFLTLHASNKKRKGKAASIAKSTLSQFEWLIQQTVRWARADGSQILGNADSPFFDEMLKQALEFDEDDGDAAAFKRVRGKRLDGEEQESLPDPSEHSEWSEVSVMRSSWDPNAAYIGLRYAEEAFGIEVGCRRETILSGASNLKLSIDGAEVRQDSEWSDVCWESDDDVDYLELECSLGHGWRLQRQMLLARDEQFFYFADAVLGPKHAAITYQHTFTTSARVLLEAEEETTEVTVLGEQNLARLLPLALPEWKASLDKYPPTGRLRLDPLRLEMQSEGHALYAPLFFCLSPKRRTKPLTWRQLTVAENLVANASDEAVAYRAQIGSDQWVFYRSLTRPGNRTFLGFNLLSDFYAARFSTHDETHLLIDVEPDPEEDEAS